MRGWARGKGQRGERNWTVQSESASIRASVHQSRVCRTNNGCVEAYFFLSWPSPSPPLLFSTLILSLEIIFWLAPTPCQFQRQTWWERISPKNSIIALTAEYSRFFVGYSRLLRKNVCFQLWSSSSEFNFMYHWWRIILIIWVRVESSHWTLFKPANLKNTDSLSCKRIVQVTTRQHSSLKQ